jgi:hypothetical protein
MELKHTKADRVEFALLHLNEVWNIICEEDLRHTRQKVLELQCLIKAYIQGLREDEQ